MIKFYNYNLVDQVSTVVTAGDENAFFPASNIGDTRATKVFRSNGVSDSVVFDFITTEEVDTILLRPHPINGWGFNPSITVEANATDSWGAPAFSTTITGTDIDQVHEVAIKTVATQSYRYWRLTFSSSTYVEVARVFIGKEHLIGTGRSISYGWSYQDADRSNISENRYGGLFIDEINSQTMINFEMQYLSKDEVDDFFEIYDINKRRRPFWVRIGCDNMINNKNRFAGEFYFTAMPQVTNVIYAKYNVSVNLREGM